MKKFFAKKTDDTPAETPNDETGASASSFASFDAALQAEMDEARERESGSWEPAARERPRLRIKFNPRLLLGLLVLAALAGLAWAVVLGPLRPFGQSLATSVAGVLNPPTSTPTPTFTPVPPTPTRTPFPPTYTPAVSSTPTDTPTPEASPTPEVSPTSTAAAGDCLAADIITLADVGKTLCVTGTVFKTNEKPSAFTIIVGSRPDSFFFVSYDRTWPLNKGQCVYATGEIVQLGTNPIMLVGWKPTLELCP